MHFLEKTAKRVPDSPALVQPGRVISYRELAALVSGVLSQLEKIGIQPGEPVAILSENRLESVILLIALWYHGAVAVPVSTRWPAKTVLQELEFLNIQRLIVSRRFAGFTRQRKLRRHSLEKLVNLSHQNPEKTLRDRWLRSRNDATIIFTSGSSGDAKAVVHRLANHYYNALGSNRNIPLQPGDYWLLSLPLYHVGGLAIIFRNILAGSAIALPEPGMDIATALEALPITHLSLVTTQLRRLLENFDHSPGTLARLKAVLVGGSSVPFPLIEQALSAQLPLLTTYGNTEMASQVTTTPPNDTQEHLRTSGKLLPYRELRIDENGEILLRGRTLCRGFFLKGTFHPAREKDGWYHSRDVGAWTDDGYLVVKGRLDNMFISGGENIQPEEIERVLEQYPGIRQALVVPVEDTEFGERPVAFLDTDHQGLPPEAELRKFLSKHLPRFKIPDHFLYWPEEFRISTAKIDRRLAQCLARHRLG